MKEARRNLEEVAKDLGPELEQAKEGLKDTAEDVGEGLRNVAERLTGRRERQRNYCASCGTKNAEGAKFCVECGKPLA